MYMPMIFNYKSVYLLFTSWFKIFLILLSILVWNRFRSQLEKRIKRVRIHFMTN